MRGVRHEERESMASLKDVRVGETCTVSKLSGTGAIKRRIMDMGITKGTHVYVRKVAPLGDPIEVTVRGYELSLRKDEGLPASRSQTWRRQLPRVSRSRQR